MNPGDPNVQPRLRNCMSGGSQLEHVLGSRRRCVKTVPELHPRGSKFSRYGPTPHSIPPPVGGPFLLCAVHIILPALSLLQVHYTIEAFLENLPVTLFMPALSIFTNPFWL